MDQGREDRESAKRTGLRLSTGRCVDPGKSVEKGRRGDILGGETSIWGKKQNTEWIIPEKPPADPTGNLKPWSKGVGGSEWVLGITGWNLILAHHRPLLSNNIDLIAWVLSWNPWAHTETVWEMPRNSVSDAWRKEISRQIGVTRI